MTIEEHFSQELIKRGIFPESLDYLRLMKQVKKAIKANRRKK